MTRTRRTLDNMLGDTSASARVVRYFNRGRGAAHALCLSLTRLAIAVRCCKAGGEPGHCDERAICRACVVLMSVGSEGLPKCATRRASHSQQLQVQIDGWGLLEVLCKRTHNEAQRTPKPMQNVTVFCYMNALLQCLFSCTTIVDYYETYSAIQNMGLGGEMPIGPGHVINEVLYKIVDMVYGDCPHRVVDSSACFQPVLNDILVDGSVEQQDAHEFFAGITLGKTSDGMLTSNYVLQSRMFSELVNQRVLLNCNCVYTDHDGTEKYGYKMDPNRDASVSQLVCISTDNPPTSYSAYIAAPARTDHSVGECEQCGANSAANKLFKKDIEHLRNIYDTEIEDSALKLRHIDESEENGSGEEDGEGSRDIERLHLRHRIEKSGQILYEETLKLKDEFQMTNSLRLSETNAFSLPAPLVFSMFLQRSSRDAAGAPMRSTIPFDVEEYLKIETFQGARYKLVAMTSAEGAVSSVSRYRACGVMCHSGQVTYGHYVAHVRRELLDGSQQWYLMNDSGAPVLEEFHIFAPSITTTVCMVFYERLGA